MPPTAPSKANRTIPIPNQVGCRSLKVCRLLPDSSRQWGARRPQLRDTRAQRECPGSLTTTQTCCDLRETQCSGSEIGTRSAAEVGQLRSGGRFGLVGTGPRIRALTTGGTFFRPRCCYRDRKACVGGEMDQPRAQEIAKDAAE